MTKEEIKELPIIIDMLLSESVLVDTKEKIHEKLAEVCSLAIKVLDQEPCEDCVNRQFILNLGATCIATRNEKTGDLIALGAIEELPSATPIRPKGHWIFKKTVFDKFGNTVECSSCHKKWKTYDEIRWRKENKFCPNCGSDNREVIEE